MKRLIMVVSFIICISVYSTHTAAQSNRPITAIAWNNDNTKLAIARANATIEIQDLTDQSLAVIDLDSTSYSLDWSPVDNNVLVASTLSGPAKVFTITNDTVSTRDLVSGVFVTQAKWNNDGTLLALMGQSDITQPYVHSIQIWDTATWTPLPQTYADSFILTDIAWSPQNSSQILLTGVLDNEGARTALWDVSTDETIWYIEAPDEAVMHLAWQPDANAFATIMNDEDGLLLRVHNANDGMPVGTIPTRLNAFGGHIEWSPSSNLVVYSTGIIEVWDTSTLELVSTISVDDFAVLFAINADGSQIAYENNGIIDIADLPFDTDDTANDNATQSPEPRPVRQIAISGDRQTLAVIYDVFGSSIIDVFDANTLHLIETIDVSPYRISRIALSPDGERVLWFGGNENFSATAIYDRRIQTNEGVPGPYFPEDISTWNPVNGIIAYSMGAGIDLYDSNTDEGVLSITFAPAVSDLAWSSDGRYLASSHFSIVRNRAIALWDTTINDSDTIQTIPLFSDDTVGGGQIEFSPDGNRMAFLDITENDNQLMIYDLPTNMIAHTIPFAENYPVFEWSSDGQYMAIGSANIRIFDTNTWDVVQTIDTELPVSSPQWSLDGQRIFHDGGPDGIYVDELSLDD